MSFLPTDFKLPTTNNGYLKLQPGENKIRVLSDPIIGWQDWDSINNKPVRAKYDSKPQQPLDPKRPTSLFIAMIVWDYAQCKICILQITQSSVMKAIDNLSKDKDWGSVFRYDIKINKIKKNPNGPLEGMNISYEVKPLPHKDLEIHIRDEFEKTPINLEELYSGADPFKSAFKTKAFWQMAPQPLHDGGDYIPSSDVGIIEDTIANHIGPMDPQWRSNALTALKIASFDQLPKSRYAMVMKRIEDKIASLLEQDIPF